MPPRFVTSSSSPSSPSSPRSRFLRGSRTLLALADRLSSRFLRREALDGAPRAPKVLLAAGTEDNGLAIMLGDLVRQNLDAKPGKKADFAALDGRIAIVAADADVALTLVFERGPSGTLTIHDGIVGIPDVTIRGPSDSILALSNMPIATPFGLPIPMPGDRDAVKVVNDLTRAMREGKLHMYGMLLHVPMVMKLTRVMSVNG